MGRWWNDTEWGKRRTGKATVPVLLRSTKISQGMNGHRTVFNVEVRQIIRLRHGTASKTMKISDKTIQNKINTANNRSTALVYMTSTTDGNKNKTGNNVRVTIKRGAFRKPLLQRKTTKYYARARVCVCVCVICDPLWLLHIFRHYLINGTIFEKKKLLNTKCVFWFSLQLLFKTLLILRRIQRDSVVWKVFM